MNVRVFYRIWVPPDEVQPANDAMGHTDIRLLAFSATTSGSTDNVPTLDPWVTNQSSVLLPKVRQVRPSASCDFHRWFSPKKQEPSSALHAAPLS